MTAPTMHPPSPIDGKQGNEQRSLSTEVSSGIVASKQLEPGTVYTRADLRALFGIHDATLNTGIFRPKGYDSVWLFITEQKTSDRTQYADTLAGDTLHMEGQLKGRTDALILDHRQRGLELLVFYPESQI